MSTTADRIGHGTVTFGRGFAHHGSLAGTLYERQLELRRLIGLRHSTIVDEQLETDISTARAAVEIAISEQERGAARRNREMGYTQRGKSL